MEQVLVRFQEEELIKFKNYDKFKRKPSHPTLGRKSRNYPEPNVVIDIKDDEYSWLD